MSKGGGNEGVNEKRQIVGCDMDMWFEDVRDREDQGRIHGHQLRTGGQGRFPTFQLERDGRTNGPTDGQSLL